MIVDHCSRWGARCATFVTSAAARFDPRRYEVAEIPDDTTARAFVEAHHYSGAYCAAWRRFGLYEGAELVGVVVFSVPARMEALRPFPLNAAAELGRLVLLDRVPFNAETWLVTRCAEVIRRDGLAGFVMFSDPFARATLDGRTVHVGHRGVIYMGLGATYLGQAHADTVYLLPDGRLLARRALAKIRTRDQGWRYAVDSLVAVGARAPTSTASGEDLTAWLAAELPRVTRKVRHPGNLKYAFALTQGARSELPASLPYVRLARPVCEPFTRRAA